MKYTFSVSKTIWTERLSEIEEWMHEVVNTSFGWLDLEHYYIIVDHLDPEEATMLCLKLGFTIVKTWE